MSAGTLVLPAGIDPHALFLRICNYHKPAADILMKLLERSEREWRIVLPFPRMAGIVGWCVRACKSNMRRLRSLGFVDADRPGRACVYSVALDRVQQAINSLLFRTSGPTVSYPPNGAPTSAPNGAPGDVSQTPLVHHSHTVQCPACGVHLHVCSPQNQTLAPPGVHVVPVGPPESYAQTGAPNSAPMVHASASSSYSRDREHINSSSVQEPPHNRPNPKNLDEIFLLSNQKTPKLRTEAPCAQLEFPYSSAWQPEMVSEVRMLITSVAAKWRYEDGTRTGRYLSEEELRHLPVEDAVVHEILQAGPIDDIRGAVQHRVAQYRPTSPLETPGKAQLYVRSFVWDVLRGVRYGDLPSWARRRFRRSLPRKPATTAACVAPRAAETPAKAVNAEPPSAPAQDAGFTLKDWLAQVKAMKPGRRTDF